MYNESDYIFIKLCCGEHKVNSCFISGLSLMELYCIFDRPSGIVLSYNEMDNVQIVNEIDFDEYTKDRFKYYDIVCADVEEKTKLNELKLIEILNNFVRINSPVPISWLPDEIKSFGIYSHDECLYSYLCFRENKYLFVQKLLEKIFEKTGRNLNFTMNNNLVRYFCNIFLKGAVIDIRSIDIIEKHLKIKISFFNEEDIFSNMIFSHKPIIFKDVSILL